MAENKEIGFQETYDRKRLNDLYRQIPLKDTTSRLLRKYFNAFAHLYGIIPLWKAYEIIHSQCPRIINEEQFYAFAEIARHECEDFVILGEEELYVDGKKTPLSQYEIIDGMLFEKCTGEDGEAFILTKKYQGEKPYYIPDKQKLLLYADALYYDETKELEAVFQFFTRTLKMNEVNVYFAIKDMCFTTRYTHSRDEEGLPKIVGVDYRKFRKKDLHTFMDLYTNFSNNSRMQCNRGYTPEEMFAMYPKEVSQSASLVFGPNIQELLDSGEWDREEFKEMLRSMGLPVDGLETMPAGGKVDKAKEGNKEETPVIPLPVKVGRNDPCPCGSGKKYKNCCGKNR